MWEAEVWRTERESGRFSVIVEFKDGKNMVREKYTTTNPSDDWLKRQIRQTIERLERVYNYTPPKGVVEPGVEPIKPAPDPDIERYYDLKRKFDELKALVDLGVVSKTDVDFEIVTRELETLWKKVVLGKTETISKG